MTNLELINAVKAKPEIRLLLLPVKQGGLGLNDTDLTKMVQSHVDAAIFEVALAYDWDFAIKETTTTTTADESDYTFEGDDHNCLQVADLKYDTGERLLLEKTHAWVNDYLTRNNLATPTFWIRNGRDSKYPAIRIVAAPTEGSIQLKYRYWRSNIGLVMFPDLFKALLESAIAKHLIPAYADVFEDDLARAISGYTRSAGGMDIAVLDPVITQGNQRRAALHGWKG
jgi:hypothetical protein